MNNDDKESASFCLSGRSKPFSKKQELTSDKKARDVFPKFKSAKSSVDVEVAGIRERPKTAVKKAGSLKPSSTPWSRPSSANTRVKYRAKMRFPGLRSTQSIDSAVSSQHSSTEDDKSSEEEEEDRNEDSHGPLTSEEDDEDCSEDSGIIKVRVVSRSSTEDKTDNSSHSSPPARAILVKEFNRTPDILDSQDDPPEEIVDCAPTGQEEESEDEESRLDPPPQPSICRPEDPEEEDLTVQTDVKLLEVGSEDESEIIPKVLAEKSEMKSSPYEELRIDDIECDETDLKNAEINQIQSIHQSQVSQQNCDEYNPQLYQTGVKESLEEGQNSALLELVKSGTEKSYEEMIESTIMRLEKEEVGNDPSNSKINISLITKTVENNKTEEARLSEAELENLKQKCITRMKTQQSTPIVTNPPVLKEFSNSQKLLNFLDEAEEKDKTILNSVKRSSYNLQVRNCLQSHEIKIYNLTEYFLQETNYLLSRK